MVLAFYENVDIPERRLAGVAMAACKKAFEKAKRWRRRRNESGKEGRTSWAVIATDDKAFDQRMLQAMAKRFHGFLAGSFGDHVNDDLWLSHKDRMACRDLRECRADAQ